MYDKIRWKQKNTHDTLIVYNTSKYYENVLRIGRRVYHRQIAP
jgi:hypothetical protein